MDHQKTPLDVIGHLIFNIIFQLTNHKALKQDLVVAFNNLWDSTSNIKESPLLKDKTINCSTYILIGFIIFILVRY